MRGRRTLLFSGALHMAACSHRSATRPTTSRAQTMRREMTRRKAEAAVAAMMVREGTRAAGVCKVPVSLAGRWRMTLTLRMRLTLTVTWMTRTWRWRLTMMCWHSSRTRRGSTKVTIWMVMTWMTTMMKWMTARMWRTWNKTMVARVTQGVAGLTIQRSCGSSRDCCHRAQHLRWSRSSPTRLRSR